MHLTLHHRTRLHAWVTSAVLLAALTACSRSDRVYDSTQDQTGTATTTMDTAAAAGTQGVVGTAGVDTNATTPDTSLSPETATTGRAPRAQGTVDRNTQPSRSTPAPDTSVAGYQPMASDTAAPETAGASADTVAVGDSANIGKTGDRLEPTESPQQANTDTLENQSEADRVRPPEDSSEVLGSVTTSDSVAVAVNGDTSVTASSDTSVTASSDTSVTASTEMARDTSTVVAQADTSVQVQVDTTTQAADTGSVTPADTGVAVQAQMDTTTADQQTEVAVQDQDTSIVVGDSTEMGKTGERLEPTQASAQANADTIATEADRVRPPEDSTEMLGNVATEEDRAKNEAETSADQAPAAAAGAQVSGTMVTGAAAVAQITREGRRCAVVQSGETEGDSEEDIRWDLAGSPATMNPCGTGTMTLPRIQTEERR